jgi:hypothetical protein
MTAGAAKRASAAVITQYDERRRAAFQSQVDELLTGLDTQLTALKTALEPGAGGPLKDPRTTEYSRLLAQRNQLALMNAESGSYTRVIDQPRAEPQGGPATALKALAVGMLLGAVVGAALTLLIQRFRLV